MRNRKVVASLAIIVGALLSGALDASAADRILGAARVQQETGNIRLADDIVIGRKVGQAYVSTPNVLQITGAGSTGAVDGMSLQREPLANVLTLRQKMAETISVADYASPDGRLNQEQLNRLANACKTEGKAIRVPGRTWIASGQLLLNNSTDTGFLVSSPRCAIMGEGASNTFWLSTGPGQAFAFLGSGQGTGHEAHQSISGLTIVGPNTDGSIGIGLDHIAWLRMDDVHVTGFDLGMYGKDVEYLRAFQTVIRFNKRGVLMDTRANVAGVTADPNSSNPNSHSWVASSIGNNTEYGAAYLHPNSLGFYGTDIQYNGLAAPDGNNAAAARPGFGVKVINPGTQGGNGITISGGYIEGQGGVADIWLVQNDPAYVSTSATNYSISGTGFTRTFQAAAQRTTNFIAADFITASGPQALKIDAAFKNYNGAVATGPAVGFIGAKKQLDVEIDMTGSVYSPGEEVDEWVPVISTVTRPTATSGFAGSVSMLATKKWRTGRVDGNVTVSASGAGGVGGLNVAMPFFSRARFTSCSASDLNGSQPLYGAMAQGSNILVLNVPLADNRSVSFSCEYPIN